MILIAARMALAVLALGGVVTAALEFRHPPEIGTGTPQSQPAAAGATRPPAADLAAVARRTTPFRMDRRPPDVRFGVAPPVTAPAPPPAPKPTLALSGILWGREPMAIVEGVPGREGPVVIRPGDRVGPLEVVRIEADRVRIRGLDTAWTLTVREPWK
jgi:hypothetical protein